MYVFIYCVCLCVSLQLARPVSMVPNIPGIPGPPMNSSSGPTSPIGMHVPSEAKMVSRSTAHDMDSYWGGLNHYVREGFGLDCAPQIFLQLQYSLLLLNYYHE